MIPSLAPLFQGAFAGHAGVLRLAVPDEQALPLRALLEPAYLREQLHRFRPDLAGEDERALLSIWSKYYFLRLIPPVLAANLILQRALPLSPQYMAVELDGEGLPSTFVLPDDGVLLSGKETGLARFEGLLRDNLATMIDGWHQASGLSPRVLWSNASRYLRWFVQELERVGLPESLWLPGKQTLETRTFSDGTRNPLHGAYQTRTLAESGETVTVRRLCCIRYLLPAMELCEDCPRLCSKGVRAEGRVEVV
ncbi:MAG: siderophore-iron reductase FhuF [Pseudomonadales bacterium]|nr:siderophore-iron reductase FhuF [Pseudomonadales bacterium]